MWVSVKRMIEELNRARLAAILSSLNWSFKVTSLMIFFGTFFDVFFKPLTFHKEILKALDKKVQVLRLESKGLFRLFRVGFDINQTRKT